MRFFNWFLGKSHSSQLASGSARPDADSSGLSRDPRSRPARQTAALPLRSAGAEPSSARKSQRHAKRELLYTAVREAMLRAGVLSASYKFKVLSLDPHGNQFMVMMDLAQACTGQTQKLADIEAMISQAAKSRYNIEVTAVYWRVNEWLSKPSLHGASRPLAAAEGFAVKPAAARYEAIDADEVAAFKKALAAATELSQSRSYTLLTGFEETEMPESPAAQPALSTTQYGDLR